jgi:hypothetical protein
MLNQGKGQLDSWSLTRDKGKCRWHEEAVLLHLRRALKLLHGKWTGSLGLSASRPTSARHNSLLFLPRWVLLVKWAVRRTLLCQAKVSEIHLEILHLGSQAWLGSWDVMNIYPSTLGWFCYWIDNTAQQISVCLFVSGLWWSLSELELNFTEGYMVSVYNLKQMWKSVMVTGWATGSGAKGGCTAIAAASAAAQKMMHQ